MRKNPPVVVAVPVKNEAEHIAACLGALTTQREAAATQILLLLNDCTDDTISVVRELTPFLGVPVRMVPCRMPPGQGSAGYARHLAMARAAEESQGGVLLTTDADGRVAPDWIAANLRCLRQGADAVAGRAIIDPVDALLIPERLHADDALECAYGDLLDEIAALLDPDEHDPWPRHWEHSGASIAVSWEAYRAAGGMPAIPLGEDRAFFRALRRTDARIRHAPEVRVTVSGRVQGRAAGGMADTIRRRLERPDEFLDDNLEPVEDAVRRARLRAELRGSWARDIAPGHEVAAALGVAGEELQACLALRFFGAAWKAVEALSPVLVRRKVPAAGVRTAIARATSVRDALRRGDDGRGDPGGSVVDDTAVPA